MATATKDSTRTRSAKTGKKTTKPTKAQPSITAEQKAAARESSKVEDAVSRVAKREYSDEERKKGQALTDDLAKAGGKTDAEKLREQAEAEKESRAAKAGARAGGKSKGKAGTPKGDSLLAKIEKVLRTADGPMSVSDIVEKLPKGTFTDVPTPPRTRTNVQLATATEKGRAVRVDKGVYDLAELNPRGAKKRPAKK
jgi:hypothetical protein